MKILRAIGKFWRSTDSLTETLTGITKMNIYYAFNEEYEAEAMFDANGGLLYYWCCNDAQWRQEYFGPFMERIGITILGATEEMNEKLNQICIENWGVLLDEL